VVQNIGLVTGIQVLEWYDRGEWGFVPASKRNGRQFSQYENTVTSPIQLHPGMTLDLDPDVTIAVVASNGHVRSAIGKYSAPSNENAYSVALLVSYEGFNYFIGGDLTSDVEDRLVLEAAVGDLDVYKVSHHGSATSSSDSFLQAIRPEVAIISNGSLATYNHPRQSVLDALNTISGMEIYQTNRLFELVNSRSGQLVGGNVADSFIADLETIDSDGTITIVVQSGNFELTMTARSFSRTYPIERP